MAYVLPAMAAWESGMPTPPREPLRPLVAPPTDRHADEYPVPYCVNCEHFRPDPREAHDRDGYCWRFWWRNPVNGRRESDARCRVERASITGRCGPGGLYFSPARKPPRK